MDPVVSSAEIYRIAELSYGIEFFMGLLQFRQQANEFRRRTA
jgi:hypothetical protein